MYLTLIKINYVYLYLHTVNFGPHTCVMAMHSIYMYNVYLLAVPFLIAVIHIFLAAGLGGCCFVEPFNWELEYGDFAVK